MKKNPEIAVLQEQVHELQEDVSEIMKNHLPHIYTRLGKIEVKLAIYAGGIVVATWLLEHYFR